VAIFSGGTVIEDKRNKKLVGFEATENPDYVRKKRISRVWIGEKFRLDKKN